ncbi:alanine-rich protein [Streptomyces lividans TK24]|uniref:Alanine-rich protein n=3 Tax=Actinomycetes TaxID=1760 RepID=A0ABN4DXI3_STRLI|nr:alanine-rich protein [Streptomyces lividans TK24]QSJ10710.1 alanine-rich protein [Streptomyces lividans]QTD71620.1 alanine-rich protein [Streptomyces lividans TK24] [Streptomyces lividans]
MMRSSPETTTRTTGAHRAHREARDRTAARALAQPPAQRPPARYAAYDAYLDGLFTYCLSVLCDHDAATAALGDVLAIAERRGHRGPAPAADRRSWLYALARWACLRKLAEAKQKRPSTHAAGRPAPATRQTAQTTPTAPTTPTNDETHQRHRSELALLAWPEAAGTTPEQREALELAVRHHLAPHEVAAVLGTDLAATRELLASAACEVERTRAALAVVETGTCAGVARLTGDNRYVLSTALRRELVRHVDDCPRCRRTAERAIPGRWPGTSVTPAELPVLEAPRTALHVALAHTSRARSAAPRFDRRGFPMDPKDRAARRDRLRARAVTTTVVATVVAAPVLALWAAYRGTPVVEGEEGRSASASEAQDPDATDGESSGGAYGYENAGNASTTPGTGFGEKGGADVSVEVVGVSGASGKAAGHLEVTAGHDGDTTLVTLTATGDAPVHWSASVGASWLYLSQSSGTLRPGEAVTVRVYVDHLREPSGRWSARVAVSPAGAVVAIEGYGTAPAPSRPGPRPGPPDDTSSPSHPGGDPDPGPDPSPSTSQPPDPTPTGDPSPTPPDPDPTTNEPSPTGGTNGSSPPPGNSDSGAPSPSDS